MNQFKRSKTSISDLAQLDADLDVWDKRPAPAKEAQRTRPKRGFSVAQLTQQVGIKKTSRNPIERTSIDRASISRPIINRHNPITCDSPTLVLGEVSPPSSLFRFPTANSSPGPSQPVTLRSTSSHAHSLSDPKFLLPPPSRPPPPRPSASSACSSASDEYSALTETHESPFEFEGVISKLLCRNIVESIKNMEPSRLQPPAAGTKGRAIAQAKEMQELVAERAKRSGDEPPPYDFFELIGKGAYGRVFKGLVNVAHPEDIANGGAAKIATLMA